MIVKQALQYSYKILKQADIVRPEFEAELIISSILGLDRNNLITKDQQKITYFQFHKIKAWTKKRTKHCPLAYLIGNKEFYNLNFKVNKHTLVPRPESELFIDYLKSKDFNNSLIIDLGTGSGCLIISLIKNLNLHNFSNYQFLATDISKQALTVAKKNTVLHQVKNLIFKQGNLLKPVLDGGYMDSKKNVFILANLPYVSKKQYQDSLSIQKEPKSALLSDNNGLAHYLSLIEQIKTIKNKQLTVLLEIDPTQTNKLQQVLQNNFSDIKIQVIKDLSNKDRLLVFNN